MTMTIGDNLKRIRGDITQEELAEVVGVDRSTIAKIEKNTRTLSLSVAYEIAEYCKADLKDFFK